MFSTHRKQKERTGSRMRPKTLKAHPSSVLPPARLHILKVPPLQTASLEALNVQIHEPMGAISHLNYHTGSALKTVRTLNSHTLGQMSSTLTLPIGHKARKTQIAYLQLLAFHSEARI